MCSKAGGPTTTISLASEEGSAGAAAAVGAVGASTSAADAAASSSVRIVSHCSSPGRTAHQEGLDLPPFMSLRCTTAAAVLGTTRGWMACMSKTAGSSMGCAMHPAGTAVCMWWAMKQGLVAAHDVAISI